MSLPPVLPSSVPLSPEVVFPPWFCSCSCWACSCCHISQAIWFIWSLSACSAASLGQIFLLGLLDVLVKVGDELGGLLNLGLQVGFLRLQVGLLFAEVGQGLLIVRLGLLGGLARGAVLLVEALVGVHYFADVVHRARRSPRLLHWKSMSRYV